MNINSSLCSFVLLCASLCLASEPISSKSRPEDRNLVIEETQAQITTKDGSIYTKDRERLFDSNGTEFFIVLETDQERVLSRQEFINAGFDPNAKDE